MKKLVIGCLATTVLLAVVGMAATYWLYSKVTSTIGQLAELSSVPEIERQVSNTAAFSPPASGQLTADQLRRLLSVQDRVRTRLGSRVGELEQKYRIVMEKRDATAFDLPRIIAAYRDLAGTWLDAKREQVAALNDHKFSLDEYRWVRRQTYVAVGVPIMELDVARIIDDVRNGRSTSAPGVLLGAVGPSGPEENQKLVLPFKQQLEQGAPLAVFGL
jgi:hypothetical protein